MSKTFKKDLTGRRFGRLTVLEFVPSDKHSSYWKCRCDCGNVTTARALSLQNGDTQSCGCLRREQIGKLRKKHSLSHTRLFSIWKAVKTRCYNPNSINYKYYGGRGIAVCDEWKHDFQAFYDWAMANGYSDNLTIDRIDNDGNYEPQNCRWEDIKTQRRNRRNAVFVEYSGQKMTLAEAAEQSGITYGILKKRYHHGDRDERLFRPVREINKK